MPVAYQVRPSWSRAWIGVVAGGFGVVLGGFDGGQVAEDDAAPRLPAIDGSSSDGEQGFLCLRQVPGFELGVALECGQPGRGEPGEPVR